MFQDLIGIARANPEILIFLGLALGYLLGKVKFFGLSLGSTVWVLVIALVLGQVDVQIPELLRTVGFALFIFIVGYQTGPQFFSGLKKEGLNYLWLTLIVCFVGLGVVWAFAKAFNLDQGSAAGLLAGSLTQTAALGTAQGAIQDLGLSAAETSTLDANVAIGYGITYIIGVIMVVLFAKIVPTLIGLDLKKASGELLQQMTGQDPLTAHTELFSWFARVQLRAFRVDEGAGAGKSVGTVVKFFPEQVDVDRVKRGDEITEEPPDDFVLESGDVIALIGGREALLEAQHLVGPEISDPDVEDVVGESMEICVTKPAAVGKTLAQIGKTDGRGLFLKGHTRQGRALPLTPTTVVRSGDILQVIGPEDAVERAIDKIGYAERPTAVTDLVIVGIGVVFGVFIGLIKVPIGGVPITLGTGGGVLVSGLFFGWLRSLHPTYGQVPQGAAWLLNDLGLNLFIVCLGLSAAPQALQTLQTIGAPLVIAGVVAATVPVIAGFLFGMIIKMDPVLLLGATVGAETSNPAINALVEDAGNEAPVLGFTVPYAIGNVLLTVWGTVIVALT